MCTRYITDSYALIVCVSYTLANALYAFYNIALFWLTGFWLGWLPHIKGMMRNERKRHGVCNDRQSTTIVQTLIKRFYYIHFT